MSCHLRTWWYSWWLSGLAWLANAWNAWKTSMVETFLIPNCEVLDEIPAAVSSSELKHQEEFLVSENGIIPSGKLMALCQARFWVCARRCSILFTASWSHIFEDGYDWVCMGQYRVPAKRSLVTATTTSIDGLRQCDPLSGSLSRLGLAARGWAFGAPSWSLCWSDSPTALCVAEAIERVSHRRRGEATGATNWGSFSLKGRQNPKWTIRGRKKNRWSTINYSYLFWAILWDGQ